MPTKNTTVTDKDVQKARDRVDKLRGQRDEAEAALRVSEANRNNVVIKATLDVEGDRLEQELATMRERVKVSAASADDIVPNPEPDEVDTTPNPLFEDPKEK